MELKVLSWNIWIDGDIKEWERYLRQEDPDIIGLQEVKDDDPKRDIISVLEGLGYEHIFARTEQKWGGKIYRHGPALFSKFPFVVSEKIQLQEGEGERAAAYAEIDVRGKSLYVFSTHLVHTHQEPSDEQDAQTQKLIEQLPPDHVIVMGDFNAVPESAPIEMMRNILVDTDPTEEPTWSAYPSGCSCRLLKTAIDTKLDYIFVSSDLVANSFEVGNSRGSDHLPVSVVIEI